MDEREKNRETPRRIPRRNFIGVFTAGGVGLALGYIFGVNTFHPHSISPEQLLPKGPETTTSHEPKPEKVPFLFPEKKGLTLEEYSRQFDLIFETGLKISHYGPKDFGQGNNMEGSVWFNFGPSVNDGWMSLQRGKTTDYEASGLPKEPKTYRWLQIQNTNSLSAPKIPGLTNYMISVNLDVVESIISDPKLSVLKSSSEYDHKDLSTEHEEKTLTGEELFDLAKAMTETYNWAVENDQLIQ